MNFRTSAVLFLGVVVLPAVGCGEEAECCGPPLPGALAVEVVATGLNSPLALTAPEGDARQFVVEQPGRIRIVRDTLLTQPFLDITGIVQSGGERGLLGLAFHLSYAANGFFFVYYTNNSGDTRVARYSVSTDPNVADPASASTILSVAQPFGNHNGGALVFGPDGMLYIGLGDGGNGGDPLGHGQDSTTLLGTILRIDVDGGSPYAIPSDNPFAGHASARPEIWAYGLRNPWRFSIDAVDGLVYIGDVGQSAWEEVDAVPRATNMAYNFGWNTVEGLECFQSGSCDLTAFTPPVVAYPTATGCAIVGGYVYRGSAINGIQGTYFYSDFCSGWLPSFRLSGGAATEQQEWDVAIAGQVLSLGEDADGELYVLSDNGTVYRLVSGP